MTTPTTCDVIGLAEERVLNLVCEVRALLEHWDSATRRTPLPEELLDATEDLVIALADAEFAWPPERSRLLVAATAFARVVDENLQLHSAIVNLSMPSGFLDSLRRVLAASECVENPPTLPGPTVAALPTLAELSRGNASGRFVSQTYGWKNLDGLLDEQRGMFALVDFRAGRPVKHPTRVRFSPREASGVIRHAGMIQFIADALLRRREQAAPTSLKTWHDEVEEVAEGDVRPMETPYPAAPRGRPAA